ncbi:hypothetical protein UY775_15145 [Escherichia coli]|uniref:Uncharacterized protein n=1 Tax=Salmonella newport TaxID=108619 RepID=A0A5U9VSS6_SALNE|nr:hypothetical protein [Salmonella enterica]EBG3523246.1 hypothetical protein [Salmonella enterica subsp. enterica]EBS4548867.1 hypothetical protein [Salmonella enterica subsp. enterica serovar Newport]ECF2281328.1 hypothetical protein [Salmonella enterica subsp. enterica serovar Chester]EDC6416254.1 hypothetical protein [Salmonella enterica subsp. enterica serovar Kottbus]EGP2905201.1 hypothetical protein [Salmonella enterica subsp. enterica serovar Muenster]MDY8671120.1 hypothetical protei
MALSDRENEAQCWYLRRPGTQEWRCTENKTFMKFCEWKGWEVMDDAEWESYHSDRLSPALFAH